MKKTDQIALVSVGVGIAAGFGSAWVLEGAHWGVHLAVGLLVAAGWYQGYVQLSAAEKIANSSIDKS